jgi:hypothetical protein
MMNILFSLLQFIFVNCYKWINIVSYLDFKQSEYVDTFFNNYLLHPDVFQKFVQGTISYTITNTVKTDDSVIISYTVVQPLFNSLGFTTTIVGTETVSLKNREAHLVAKLPFGVGTLHNVYYCLSDHVLYNIYLDLSLFGKICFPLTLLTIYQSYNAEINKLNNLMKTIINVS